MTRKNYLLVAPLLFVPAFFAACESDDSLPSHPRTPALLTPDQKSQDNAEKRELEQPDHAAPGATGGGADHSDARQLGQPGDRSVVTLQSEAAQDAAATSKNPFNAILRELGFVGPNDWAAFGHTRGPEDVYERDPYPQSMPHLPANPGSAPMLGSIPAPAGDWSIDNSWGQGLVLTDYPHRAWSATVSEYYKGDVKHNPVYFFNVEDHIHVKDYIQRFNTDVANKNFKSQWFYLNSLGMPVWVVLEPPEVPYVSPLVQHVEQRIPQDVRDDWKSDAYDVPWFFVESAALPVLMALEPPFSERITARPSGDPTFLGHLPEGGRIVATPMPGKLQWSYPFLAPDGTMLPASPAAGEPATPPSLPPATMPPP